MTWEPPPEPAGFPDCAECAYQLTGPVETCYGCAHQSMEAVSAYACPVCSQARESSDDPCINSLCNDPARSIEAIDAIAMHSGGLKRAIERYKYQRQWGWKLIFARLLLGYLDRHYAPWDVGLVVAAPTWTGSGGRSFGHTEEVVRQAAESDMLGYWPLDDSPQPVLTLTRATRTSARGTLPEKRAAADDLAAATVVPDPSRIRRLVLVYDDVCTSGHTLDALARVLRRHGAERVRGVVLARRGWG
ncbi:ComF family protein [Egibacter rhizosphaerae]|uniref:ComF family protein n=1 Tax=Egibacter rhizosphaerae TaxID=1670831 RepID=A0A411YEF1_9ACTN|nr:phosphoribosyltransferase family protein [Egibacter rhizosphaerae]QBI19633.1 ComF family protein [Egibacter rhizosphaerae]